MKVLLQRVSKAHVEVDGEIVGKIGNGVVVFLGVMKGDTEKELEYLVEKTAKFRFFPDEKGKMNLSLLDVKGEALIISQFTLAADGKKGKRPSFDQAASPEEAESLYKKFIQKLEDLGVATASGIFGAHMHIHLINDGPVTFLLEKA